MQPPTDTRQQIGTGRYFIYEPSPDYHNKPRRFQEMQPRTSNHRRFVLERQQDATGVSGTGVVAEGVQFADGSCAISWLTAYSSIGIYPSIEEVEKIHGHGGYTLVVWRDDGPRRENEATIMMAYRCPGCNLIMVVEEDTLSCMNHHCQRHGKKFRAPVLSLTEIVDD